MRLTENRDAPLHMRPLVTLLAMTACLTISHGAIAQATTRPCGTDSAADSQPGPACLLAHQSLGKLGGAAVYWHLDRYASTEAAQKDRGGNAAQVQAFGATWLFAVGTLAARPMHGEHVATLGPIPVASDTDYAAAFLKSTFSPGMTAPVHVHSGPEVFYALSGDTCLETPDGVQRGRGPGDSIIVRGGPPMLLAATGTGLRQGFALILHDMHLAPTTLVHDWTPKGLCIAPVR